MHFGVYGWEDVFEDRAECGRCGAVEVAVLEEEGRVRDGEGEDESEERNVGDPFR